MIFAAPLYSVAEDQEAAQVQRVVVRQLGMNSNEIQENWDFGDWVSDRSPVSVWCLNFFCQGCIVVGVLLMLVSTIGGLRSIIQDASTFQFYS
jgi:hypothetical protein